MKSPQPPLGEGDWGDWGSQKGSVRVQIAFLLPRMDMRDVLAPLGPLGDEEMAGDVLAQGLADLLGGAASALISVADCRQGIAAIFSTEMLGPAIRCEFPMPTQTSPMRRPDSGDALVASREIRVAFSAGLTASTSATRQANASCSTQSRENRLTPHPTESILPERFTARALATAP